MNVGRVEGAQRVAAGSEVAYTVTVCQPIDPTEVSAWGAGLFVTGLF